MPYLYENKSSYPLPNAQQNLMGRTHYVDPDTLRFHKSKVLAAHVVDNGLLFAIITSDSLNYENTKRGFRYVIFNLFGTVLDRPKLDEAFKSRDKASKAMWAAINQLDAKQITLDGIANAERHFRMEMDDLRKRLDQMQAAA
jgi:hypothetical protein